MGDKNLELNQITKTRKHYTLKLFFRAFIILEVIVFVVATFTGSSQIFDPVNGIGVAVNVLTVPLLLFLAWIITIFIKERNMRKQPKQDIKNSNFPVIPHSKSSIVLPIVGILGSTIGIILFNSASYNAVCGNTSMVDIYILFIPIFAFLTTASGFYLYSVQPIRWKKFIKSILIGLPFGLITLGIIFGISFGRCFVA
jgi:hypothetical protein